MLPLVWASTLPSLQLVQHEALHSEHWPDVSDKKVHLLNATPLPRRLLSGSKPAQPGRWPGGQGCTDRLSGQAGRWAERLTIGGGRCREQKSCWQGS